MLKELDQFRRDKLTVALAFILPCAALLMYGFATRLESKDIKVATINYDIGKSSRELIDAVYSTNQLIPAYGSKRDILEPLDNTRASATIVIPPEFSRNLQNGTQATYQAVIDATDVNNARVIKNALIATTRVYEQTSGLNQTRPVIRPAVRLWYNPGRQESLYIVPGAIGLVLWIFPALLSTLSLVREKEQGTILQVYASNLTAAELMIGKALAYTIVGLMEATCLIMVGMLVFHIRFVANPFPFFLSTVLYVTSAVLFGLVAGTRANTQMAALQIVANVGFLGAMLLSGFIYPIRNIVFPLSLISNLVPAMYFIIVCRNEFVRGGDWLSLWYCPVVFLLFDIVWIFVCSRMKMELST
jgi:ABC-2 type transport system permease protein